MPGIASSSNDFDFLSRAFSPCCLRLPGDGAAAHGLVDGVPRLHLARAPGLLGERVAAARPHQADAAGARLPGAADGAGTCTTLRLLLCLFACPALFSFGVTSGSFAALLRVALQ